MAKKLTASWKLKDISVPSSVEAGMTNEEKVWHRLKNGAPARAFSDFLENEIAKTLREEIDKELIKALITPEKHIRGKNA
jgi:hypothetical protein